MGRRDRHVTKGDASPFEVTTAITKIFAALEPLRPKDQQRVLNATMVLLGTEPAPTVATPPEKTEDEPPRPQTSRSRGPTSGLIA